MKELFVFKKARLAGHLRRAERGAVFEYLDDYQGESVALTLPREKKRHVVRGDNLHPFFAGLLPEGRRLNILLGSSKIAPDDMFTMLSEIEGDFIGDVAVSQTATLLNNDLTSSDELDFEELFRRSAEAKDFGVAGVQPKLSVDRLTIPIKHRDAKYLLKLGNKQYPYLVPNECFFMQLATECGIETAETTIVSDKNNIPGLLVKRFDRAHGEKLWCEDLCQVLGRYPADKYNLSARDILAGLSSVVQTPIVQSLRALEILIFSYLIGNGDMHAKNFSVLNEDGFFRLAPAYDMLSTFPYGDKHQALKVEGRDLNLNLKTFCKLGSREGVREKAIISSANRISEAIKARLADIKHIGFAEKKSVHLQKEISRRIKSFLSA